MSMMHFEPFRSLRDLDRLSSQLLSGTQVPLAMPMDVWRQGQNYYVALDLPGVDPDAIDLRVERNTLTVSAQRRSIFSTGEQQSAGQQSGGQGQQQVLVAERPQGSFTRQLVLGEGLDTEQVQADYTNGVLHLTIPVKQSAQPRRIEVGQGAQQSAQPKVIDMTGGQQSGAQEPGQEQSAGQQSASSS